MDFNAGNIQEPWEMIERWDCCIPCTCDPDVGHLCEICHDTEVVRRLMARVAESLKIQQAAQALVAAVDALDGEDWNNQDLTTAADAVRVTWGDA
jgi:hypothetical protein